MSLDDAPDRNPPIVRVRCHVVCTVAAVVESVNVVCGMVDRPPELLPDAKSLRGEWFLFQKL